MEEQTFSPTPAIKPPSDKLFKISLIILGILIILGLFGNIYLLLKKQTSTASVVPTPIPVQISATPTIDITTDWATFTSNYGYSIRVPSDMKIGETGFGTGEPEKAEGVRIYQSETKEPLLSPHITIIVILNSKKSLQESAQTSYDQNVGHKYNPAVPVVKIHESTFLSEKSYEYILKNKALVTPHEEYSTPESEYKIIWNKKNNNIVAIFLNNIPKFDQILSTFKFD